MRRICVFLIFFLLASAAFAQQEYPRAEVYGGYSYLHIDTQGVTGSTLDALCNDALGAGTCPPGSFQVHSNFNGWNGAAQVTVNRWLGVTADFSGHYGTPVTITAQGQAALKAAGVTIVPPKAKSYSFLFGPTISSRTEHFVLFGHGLFGASDVRATLTSGNISGFAIPGLTASDTAFAMAFGGGIDARLAKRFSLRIVQADYLFTKHDFSGGVKGVAVHQNNIRIGAGIVYSFGGESMAQQPKRSRENGMLIAALGIRAKTPESGGAEILEVAPNSVAALAGLKPGDVVNAIDGKPIRTAMELAANLSSRAAGDKVRLGFMVHGAWQTELMVILGSN